MFLRATNFLLNLILAFTLIAIAIILLGYAALKPSLPEIDLVDQASLNIPLKIFTNDGVLIGEFGDQKRRTIQYQDLPENLKNAFLAAEDDQFFTHHGIRILSFARAFVQLLQSGEIVSGGGTITMQVVRGYLLSREQKLLRKIKEIYLAFELESMASKEDILALYLNTIFLGNRAYGVEAAANKYFSKSISELTLSEAALIASSAQLPSRINPLRSPDRSKVRRNWILGRMYKLGYIGKAQFLLASSESVQLTQVDSAFEVDGRYVAELARQEIIKRYGLSAYSEGLSVFTTIDSSMQRHAIKSINKNLFAYDKRHGWREPRNYQAILSEEFFLKLSAGSKEILYEQSSEKDALGMEQSNVSIIRDLFQQEVQLGSHIRAIVIDVKPDRVIYLDDQFNLLTLSWNEQYKWARKRIAIDKFGPIPQNFYDILNPGDFIYLMRNMKAAELDQIPLAQTAFISTHPSSGAIKAYVGGWNFTVSNFDRVVQSSPQAGSSFKPFIYAAAIANGYHASDLINDAPLLFEDQNLESSWRPENYTGKFYGPMRLREALVQSVNLVSIKLLRELGIDDAHEYLENFGFARDRLAPDLSLALGSSGFSPAEMVQAYSMLANDGKSQNLFIIDRVIDRDGGVIYSQESAITSQTKFKNIHGFPWFSIQSDALQRPFFLLGNQIDSGTIDPKVSFVIKDILNEVIQRGSNGRATNGLNRKDLAGKTGTTNESISTWFSGFHRELATTVWVGTDDFTSLGKNEFGSSVALPIWVDFMNPIVSSLPVDEWNPPPGISYVRVSKETGKPLDSVNNNAYFELFIDEQD